MTTHLNIRVLVAWCILGAAIAAEGLWILAALGVGGDRAGWLNSVIGAWCLMALACFWFRKFPWVLVITALINLVLCVRTFYADGQNFRDLNGLLYRHSVDLLILAASLLGVHRRSGAAHQS